MESYRLFIVVLPGMEDLALEELELKCPLTEITKLKGGLELSADLAWIERAHTLLKIPTRILMRVTEFKVRDFPKLYQKFLNFSWTPFLSHPHPQWEIVCHQSRLNHTGRMEETINKAMAEVLKRQPLSKDWEKKNYRPQTFYIRLQDDLLTLSLDLTGDPLHKRGLQTIKGEAPLRENFAAAMVYELTRDLKTETILVDPMCGSGTLLVEALTFHRPLHLRTFDFETAPFYKGKLLKLSAQSTPLAISKAFGFDTNAELLSKIQVDLPISLKVQNSLEEKIEIDGEMIMICNPPYGERIKIDGKRGSFLKQAWEKFLTVDKPFRFAWVLPSDMDDLFSKAPGYKLISKRPFRNGGIAVTYWIWEKKSQERIIH